MLIKLIFNIYRVLIVINCPCVLAYPNTLLDYGSQSFQQSYEKDITNLSLHMSKLRLSLGPQLAKAFRTN